MRCDVVEINAGNIWGFFRDALMSPRLLRWELCDGELSKLFTDFESNAFPSTSKADDFLYMKKHHEDNISFRNGFNKDVELVIYFLLHN